LRIRILPDNQVKDPVENDVPFLQIREKDEVALNMSQVPAADSRALAASPTAQAANLVGEPVFF
jgi:hypothetical protein